MLALQAVMYLNQTQQWLRLDRKRIYKIVNIVLDSTSASTLSRVIYMLGK